MVRAELVLERARIVSRRMTSKRLYPKNMDKETCGFIDFWFDSRNRIELSSLATCISRVRSQTERTLLWCAFSRMIITKISGVSLAMDVSHSRPHKMYDIAPMKPFDVFLKAVSTVLSGCPFSGIKHNFTPAHIRHGDARALPVKADSMDMVITSPPYLNAIDYLRGHKLSLVWMGYSISEIRAIRAGNIGSEISENSTSNDAIQETVKAMVDFKLLDNQLLGMLRRYVWDMNRVMKESARVLKPEGRAVFVVGDSAISGVYIKNSQALIQLAHGNGLSLISCNTRPIETSRRYLPPPQSERAGDNMQGRMREEVILEFHVDKEKVIRAHRE